MTELTPAEQARIPVPPHGRWFTGIDSQKLMLEEYHARAPAAFAVGWDTQYKGKMFGVYTSSKDEFMHLLLDIPWAQRHCYELLVENVPCKAYADVEWVGPAEPEHSTLKRMIAAMRDKIREVYSREPMLYVCCGSRPASDADPQTTTKHSYHVVCDNLIFERNNDGQMKALFTTIPGFTWMDGVEEKPMIDSRVYTKNRHFRLPHCCKIGSQHPLLRISGDPLLDEFGRHDWGRDVHAVLPFFISNPAYQGRCDCLFVPTPSVLLERMSGNGGNKRAKTTTTAAAAGDDQNASVAIVKLFPVPLQIVQRLLMLAGDTVSTLGSVQYLSEEDQWKVQGDQRGKGRKCLVSQGTTHTSNNCLLFIERFQNGFKVNYFCTARECSCHTKKVIIGYVSMNMETYEWQIALSPPSSEISPMTLDTIDDSEPVVGPDAPEEGEGDYPMQEHCDIDDMQEEEEEVPVIAQANPPHLPQVEPPFDEDNQHTNTYDLVKARFELKCFRMIKKCKYIKINSLDDVDIITHTEVSQYYSDWTYWGPDKDGNIEKLSFIHKWLHDINKHAVENIVVDPTMKSKNVYNMWRGFLAADLPAVELASQEELNVKPFINHFHQVVTCLNQDHTSWLMEYLGAICQRPWRKTNVALFLYGEQGCGKGIMFDFLRSKVLGEHCTHQTDKPDDDIFGRFANGLVNRVLIQVDEAPCLHEHGERLKNLITSTTFRYECKGQMTIPLPNLANMIFTSNNMDAIPVATDDRRFVLFRCSSVFKGNAQYFNDLLTHLDRPEVARSVYQFLMSRDISRYPYSFQDSRPVTEFYREAQNMKIPVVSRFVSALINGENDESYTLTGTSFVINNHRVQVSAAALYKKYQEYHTAGNYKYLQTQTSFGRDIKRIEGVEKQRSSKCITYILDLPAIKAKLIACNHYDEDAFLQE